MWVRARWPPCVFTHVYMCAHPSVCVCESVRVRLHVRWHATNFVNCPSLASGSMILASFSMSQLAGSQVTDYRWNYGQLSAPSSQLSDLSSPLSDLTFPLSAPARGSRNRVSAPGSQNRNESMKLCQEHVWLCQSRIVYIKLIYFWYSTYVFFSKTSNCFKKSYILLAVSLGAFP